MMGDFIHSVTGVELLRDYNDRINEVNTTNCKIEINTFDAKETIIPKKHRTDV